ncbi:MAG TPA: hypothetical protein VFG20_21555 [Planctomycetaceae bacterium]|nr:hypothetical protein [Planctomycetaceae bacterium]
MAATTRWPALPFGLIGAVLGGTLGYFGFFWVAQQGFYALLLPAGLLGLGAAIGARGRSLPLAIICGLLGLLLTLYTEWRFSPFIADESFAYFITHLHKLKPITLLFVAVGTFLSYRLALGMDSPAKAT